MAHVSRKLSNSLEGALAGGGDPATSPLYVFGPFLKLIVVGGVASVTFGASVWLVVMTIAMVSAMYRLVMKWVIDGSGGSGLSEEEFGGWAVKVNAGITFVEYTLTFLVSMAALVTFVADRFPALNNEFLGLQYRAYVAIILSIVTGWLVNRGPKVAARAFGPATAGVLLLLWAMVIGTIWKFGFQLPNFDLRAFSPEYLGFTFGGFARILAVMTGIEIFANLVAAYDGTPEEKSRRSFGSLLIIMGTTSITMLIVGPAIFQLSDPTNEHVSVFTQTMDQILPAPLPWLGTLIGIVVLLSASAASAQGLQNLALGLNHRHYIPNVIGQRNKYGVADKPVWIEVALVSICFLFFGTNEETYLAIYAAGVFILLSMTGWAAAKRLIRQLRENYELNQLLSLIGTAIAALLTTGATVIIFEERFLEGAWTYFLFIPVLYYMFGAVRKRLGEPTSVEESLGLAIAERKYLSPYQKQALAERDVVHIENVLVPLDGSDFAEQALSLARPICLAFDAKMTLVFVHEQQQAPRLVPMATGTKEQANGKPDERLVYLDQMSRQLRNDEFDVDTLVRSGPIVEGITELATDSRADVVVMSTHGRSGVARWLIGSVANRVVQLSDIPVLLTRPTGEWRSRWSQFKRLLVTLDGSESAEQVLPFVRTLASRYESEVLLLSVPEELDAEPLDIQIREYLQDMAALLNDTGISAQAMVTGFDPSQTIVEVSEDEDVDLLVIATHGVGRMERLMVGSVADQIIRQAQCPVLLVPVHD